MIPSTITDEDLADLTQRDIKIADTKTKIEILEDALSKTVTPEQIKKWILELCEASDVKFNKFGEMIHVPNWNARDKGLTRILEILHYQTADIEGRKRTRPHEPSKILIQVIGDQQVKAMAE